MYKSLYFTIPASQSDRKTIKETFREGIYFWTEDYYAGNIDIKISTVGGATLFDAKISSLKEKFSPDWWKITLKGEQSLIVEITNNESTVKTITLHYWYK